MIISPWANCLRTKVAYESLFFSISALYREKPCVMGCSAGIVNRKETGGTSVFSMLLHARWQLVAFP
jgi:hypothetical protein